MRRRDFFSAWQRWKKGTTKIQMEVGPLRVEKGRSICQDRIWRSWAHGPWRLWGSFPIWWFCHFSGANFCYVKLWEGFCKWQCLFSEIPSLVTNYHHLHHQDKLVQHPYRTAPTSPQPLVARRVEGSTDMTPERPRSKPVRRWILCLDWWRKVKKALGVVRYYSVICGEYFFIKPFFKDPISTMQDSMESRLFFLFFR